MTPDYPGDKHQEISGYTEMRLNGKYILFIIPDDETQSMKHLYFKRKYIVEIETNQGRI
jgi:hypothetical protein